MSTRIAVLGAGSWGTALSVHLGRIGHDVQLWARDAALVDDMCARRANAIYLPDVALPSSVSVTHAVDRALEDSELVIVAVPSHGVRGVMRERRRADQPAGDCRQRHEGTRVRHVPSHV